jgi:hypothetical protein
LMDSASFVAGNMSSLTGLIPPIASLDQEIGLSGEVR